MQRKLPLTDYLRIYLVYLTVTLAICTAVFLYFIRAELDVSRRQVESINEQSVQNVAEYLGEIINSTLKKGEKIRTTTWAIKLGSQTDVFEEQFSYTFQKSIQEDLFFTEEVGETIYHRAVLFRGRNLAISRSYWGDIPMYFASIGIPRDMREELTRQALESAGPRRLDCVDAQGNSYLGKNLLYIIPLRPNEATTPQIFLAVTLNTTSIQKTIGAMLSPDLISLRLMENDTGAELLSFHRDSGNREIRYLEKTIAGTQWTIEVGEYGASLIISEGAVLRYLAVYLVIVLLCAASSMLFSRITYQPLARLLHKATGREPDGNAYRALDRSIDEMLVRLGEDRKRDVVRKLLTGYFDPQGEIGEYVSFREGMTVCVCILVPQDREQISQELFGAVQSVLAGTPGLSVEYSDSWNRGLTVILGADLEDTVRTTLDHLRAAMDASGGEAKLYTGSMAQGFIGISTSYQTALDRIYYLPDRLNRFYFPFDWEGQLLTAIEQRKRDAIEAIFHGLREENTKRLKENKIGHADLLQFFARMTEVLRRSARDHGLEEDHLRPLTAPASEQDGEKMWKSLRDAAMAICGELEQRYSSATPTEEAVIAYIDEHYADPDLSVTTLEERFGLSTTTLNKGIRKLTGQTFAPYLIGRRIEESKKLLADPEMRVSTIVPLVGYENEYSFRRAFANTTGEKVQDYRKRILEQKREQDRGDRDQIE